MNRRRFLRTGTVAGTLAFAGCVGTEDGTPTPEPDDERGTVTVEQRRSPAAGGATGYADLVVLTLAVADDAAGNYTISIDDVSVRLANDQPQPAISRNGTVSVGETADDGDATVESEDAPGTGLLVVGVAVIFSYIISNMNINNRD